jgi:hypothetical protein
MSIGQKTLYVIPPALLVVALIGLPLVQSQGVQPQGFRIEEATIAGIHQAIRQGQVTCVGLVQAYLARARAYNHTSDRLVTVDGAPIPAAPGTMRAGTRDRRLSWDGWNPLRRILRCSSNTG